MAHAGEGTPPLRFPVYETLYLINVYAQKLVDLLEEVSVRFGIDHESREYHQSLIQFVRAVASQSIAEQVECFVPRHQGRPSKEVPARVGHLKKPPEVIERKTPGKCISQAEAARIRGISQEAIADLIRRSRLTAVVVGGRTLLLRSEVEAFVAKPNLGRPSKKKPAMPKPKTARG